MEISLVCPHCGYDHKSEVNEAPDAWISEGERYNTECLECSTEFTVHTHVTYSFTTTK